MLVRLGLVDADSGVVREEALDRVRALVVYGLRDQALLLVVVAIVL